MSLSQGGAQVWPLLSPSTPVPRGARELGGLYFLASDSMQHMGTGPLKGSARRGSDGMWKRVAPWQEPRGAGGRCDYLEEEPESVKAPWHPASGRAFAKKSWTDRQEAVKTETLQVGLGRPLPTHTTWSGGLGKAPKNRPPRHAGAGLEGRRDRPGEAWTPCLTGKAAMSP